MKSVDSGYEPCVTSGYVSRVGSDNKVPARILRDNGALKSVLPFSPGSDTGDCVLVRGMGLVVLTVPLHNLFLSSNLVKGEMTLGLEVILTTI